MTGSQLGAWPHCCVQVTHTKGNFRFSPIYSSAVSLNTTTGSYIYMTIFISQQNCHSQNILSGFICGIGYNPFSLVKGWQGYQTKIRLWRVNTDFFFFFKYKTFTGVTTERLSINNSIHLLYPQKQKGTTLFKLFSHAHNCLLHIFTLLINNARGCFCITT